MGNCSCKWLIQFFPPSGIKISRLFVVAGKVNVPEMTAEINNILFIQSFYKYNTQCCEF